MEAEGLRNEVAVGFGASPFVAERAILPDGT